MNAPSCPRQRKHSPTHSDVGAPFRAGIAVGQHLGILQPLSVRDAEQAYDGEAEASMLPCSPVTTRTSQHPDAAQGQTQHQFILTRAVMHRNFIKTACPPPQPPSPYTPRAGTPPLSKVSPRRPARLVHDLALPDALVIPLVARVVVAPVPVVPVVPVVALPLHLPVVPAVAANPLRQLRELEDLVLEGGKLGVSLAVCVTDGYTRTLGTKQGEVDKR